MGEKWIRGFYWTSKSWYSDTIRRRDVPFGMYNEKGNGCLAEMVMEWKELGGRMVPRLCVFSESWSVLASFCDLIARLGHADEYITEEEFVSILKGCNFKDLTHYKDPYEKEKKVVEE